MDDETLLAMISEIHAAAGNPARWHALVDRLAAEHKVLDDEVGWHLHAARMAHRDIVDLARACRLMEGAYDTLAVGIVIVDAEGRIHRANRAARRLLAQGHGLASADGQLQVTDPRTAQGLRLFACADVDGQQTRQRVTETALTVARPGQRPLSLLAVRLVEPMSEWRVQVQEPRLTLLLLDPDLPPGTTRAMLRDLFGLTPRESDLAQLLLDGQSVADAARTLGVTVNTARTLLKRATAKTGTRGQADLVYRLLSLSPLEIPRLSDDAVAEVADDRHPPGAMRGGRAHQDTV